VLNTLRGNDKNLRYDYLGNRNNTDIWLLSGVGVMQIIYAMPNDHAIIGGALVGPDGKELAIDLTRDFMQKSPERAKEILAVMRQTQQRAQAELDKGDKLAGNLGATTREPTTPDPAPDATQSAGNTPDPAKTGDGPAETTAIVTPSAPESPSEVIWRELGQTGYVSYGSETNVPVIYAILDPVQPESKTIWTQLAPLAKSNRITLHVVPLALTTGDSIMEIASVLGHKNPPAAWDDLMAGKSAIGGEPPNGDKILAIEATVKLAQRLQLRKLPVMVYRAPDGKNMGKIRMLRGVPKDWDKFISEFNLEKAPITTVTPEN